MRKIKLLGYLALFCGLFFISGSAFVSAFATKTVCQPPLTEFSNGNSTFDISFPPGGGTTCSTYPPADANCPTVKLPKGATVYSVKVDMVSATGAEIGTPYIWVPATTQHKLIQLKTSDGSLVHVFKQGADNCTANDFSYPSRITVMPRGDVWVGNRGSSNNVTRLGKKDGCVGDDCYECKGTYPTCGSESKGITFDSEGNIWAGSHSSSCLVRLCGHDNCIDVNGNGGYSIGDKMEIDSSGNKQMGSASAYGLIGDSYGNVWGVNGSTKRINISDDSAILHSTSTGDTYGIGIDNGGDIWVGKHGSTGIWEIDGADDGGAGIGNIENKCATTGTVCGVAVDKSNNVWGDGYSKNDLYVIKSGDCGKVFRKTKKADGTAGVCTYNHPHGMAVDFDNHAWLICDTGEAIKYAFHDDGDAITEDDGEDDIEELQRINLCTLPGVGCGNGSGDTYNYSDMTGLRTTPKSLTLGGTKTFLSGNTFTICSDGTTTCSNSGPCAALTLFLSTCTSDAFGDCEVPLEIFSAMAGDYTLQNLEVIYGEEVPITVGGLVPCGREWNDPDTGWDDTADCTLCHLVLMIQLIIEFLVKLAAVAAAFFLSVAGYYYIFASGNPEKVALAKKTFSRALMGFLIILIAWIIVDSILAAFGYIDPLENDEWHVMCGG